MPGVIRLDRITLREIRLELLEPFRTSAGTVTERRILLLTLADGDGTETWSECVAEALPTYSPDTVDSSWLALTQWILPAVLGQSFAAPDAVQPALERRIRGHRMACAAVEMGAWSLDATRRGIALAALLNGARSASPRACVDAGIAIGMQESVETLVEKCVAAAREGYRRIKIKVGPGRDVEWVVAVRGAVDQATALSVDANCSYSLDDPAHVRALLALDHLGLALIEQPLAHDDFVRHAELQRRLTTPLCLDESLSGESSVETMLALGSARIANVKPGRVGGFRAALTIHDRCTSAGVPVLCGGMLECGIGRAYNVALASLPNFSVPGDLSPSARYWARDVVTPPWTMDPEGRLRVPLARPGLGVDVDMDLIEDLTVRRESFQAS
ncbi:MAG TPA: o-succinylbenzoate synthase [Gemmatimonadaceae bacterium]|nr:o-succinylbenzoate synthase [Gemmatimonadaceae bacterium]